MEGSVFKYFLYRIDGLYLTQCIDYNFVSEGKSITEAIENLTINIIAQIELSKENGKKFTDDIGKPSPEVIASL